LQHSNAFDILQTIKKKSGQGNCRGQGPFEGQCVLFANGRLIMSTAGELLQVAKEISENAQLRLAALDQEEAELDARKAEIQAERENISLAVQRANVFRSQVGTDLQCPRCWVNFERRARLLTVADGAGSENFIRCRTCGFEYSTALPGE
jgi:hypothetical protein